MSTMPSDPFGFASNATLGYRSREDELTVGGFFNAVYAWMCVGLATTAVVAYGVAHYAPGLMSPGIGWVAFIVVLGLAYAINTAVNRLSATAATGLFVLLAALMGLVYSVLFFVYTGRTLTAVFAETAGLFGAMSLFGYVTKRDLSRLGSFLVMALFGLILASVVNFFLQSPGLYWIVSYVGILVFVGLTAVDTQRLKLFALQNVSNPAVAHRYAIIGSLMLYLDFVNLFIFLLQVMGGGNRRD